MNATTNPFWTTAAASSDRCTWNTPSHIVKLIGECFETIDLDPCSDSVTSPNVPAKVIYTGPLEINPTGNGKDGLVEPWRGSVFCNPVYGRTIGLWVQKAITEFDAGRASEIILLVPARTDTKWFRTLLTIPPAFLRICFLHGRLKFGNQPMPAPFPSAIVYLGPCTERFMEVFSTVGWCARQSSPDLN